MRAEPGYLIHLCPGVCWEVFSARKWLPVLLPHFPLDSISGIEETISRMLAFQGGTLLNLSEFKLLARFGIWDRRPAGTFR